MLDPVTSFQHQPLRTLSSVIYESVHTLFQMLLLSLLLLGIGGLVYKALGADGWLPGLLKSAWTSGPGYLASAIVALVLGALWLKHVFYQSPKAINRTGDALVLGCLALGVFFALRLIVSGTL